MNYISRYTKILQKYRYIIILFWAIIGIVGMVFIPKFIQATSSEFLVPPNTPGYIANNVLMEEFPKYANSTDFIVLIRCNNGTVINQKVKDFVYSLNGSLLSSSFSSEINGIESYFFFIEEGLPEAAQGLISSSNRTTIIIINYELSTDEKVSDFLLFLRSTVKDLKPEGYEIAITGKEAMYQDMHLGTKKDLTTIDSIVMPIALLIIAIGLRSFRLMLLPLISIFLSMSISFLIMYFVSFSMSVFSFVPSVMMVLIIGMSIDYSLFLLSRFKEEIKKGEKFFEAILKMLKYSGHTISMSAIILIFSFLGLVFFPVQLLTSIGIGAAVALFVTLAINLSFTPAILFIFSKFFNKFFSIQQVIEKTRKKQLKREKVQYWRKLGKFTTKYAWPLIALIIVISVPISVQTMYMDVSMDYEHTMPRHADSMKAYNIFKEDFRPGILGPMYIIVTTNKTNGVLESDFFTTTQQLIWTITNHTRISNDSFISISMAGGQPINHLFALQMLDPSTPLYNTSQARAYRMMFNEYTNADNSTALILVQPNFDPFSEYIKEWIETTRKILNNFSENTNYGYYLAGGATDVVDVMDVVYQIFPTVIIVVLVAVYIFMALMTQSVLVPLRLIFTIVLTISWVYGLAVLVFTIGIFNFIFPALKSNVALYWATPIMSFTILIGLGLDYDIFLLTRVIEYRNMGYNDKAAITLGLEKTGGIITIAGIIMAVAFSGLVISSSLVMNEFGFILCAGVLIDTFIVRTIFVPSIMAVAEKWNWWPSKKPKPTKDI